MIVSIYRKNDNTNIFSSIQNDYAAQPGFQNPVYETTSPQLQAVGTEEPEKTGLPAVVNEVAVDVPPEIEKTGPPEGGIDASQPMPEVDLPPPKEPPTYTPTEDVEGDTNVLVTKDKK